MPKKLPIRHQPAKSDVEHERNFWCWKYERREEECEELAGRLRNVLAAAEQWRTSVEADSLAADFPSSTDQKLFEAIAAATQPENTPARERD